MARLFERNPGVEVIVMTNVPGSADDEANLYISLVIHELGLWTYVPSQGEIASGGTDMFLAGERRILHPDSRVGVHSFSFDDDDGNPVSGADLPLDDEIHQFYLDYYRDIGIDEDFTGSLCGRHRRTISTISLPRKRNVTTYIRICTGRVSAWFYVF